MFQFLCFYISVYFKTLQTKATIDPDKISKEISRNTINKLLESLERNFTLTHLGYFTYARKHDKALMENKVSTTMFAN